MKLRGANGGMAGNDLAGIEAWLESSAAALDPDPFFRRRLRSEVMNHWVAEREGLPTALRVGRVAREMGRLGRACLVASVVLCGSAAGALAASQMALPGDALYALKLRVDELRVHALPAGFHDDLAMAALSERLDEVRRLAAAHRFADALALAPVIEGDYAELLTLAGGRPPESPWLTDRLSILARIVEGLPPQLRGLMLAVMPGLPVAFPVVDPPAASQEPRRSPDAVAATPPPEVTPAPEAPIAPAEPAGPAVAPPVAPKPEDPIDGGDDGGGDDGGGDDGSDDDDSG